MSARKSRTHLKLEGEIFVEVTITKSYILVI